MCIYLCAKHRERYVQVPFYGMFFRYQSKTNISQNFIFYSDTIAFLHAVDRCLKSSCSQSHSFALSIKDFMHKNHFIKFL